MAIKNKWALILCCILSLNSFALPKNSELPLPNQDLEVMGLESLMLTEKELDKIKKHSPEVSDKMPVNKAFERAESNIPDKILKIRFENLSGLNSAVELVVKEVMEIIKTKDVTRIHIVGHTDNNPILGKRAQAKFKDNMVLSRARANLVSSYFVNKGLDIPISYEGRGPNDPEASNDTPEGKALNRRTEIYIYYKKQDVKIEKIETAKKQVNLAEIGCSYKKEYSEKKTLPQIHRVENKTPDFRLIINFDTLKSNIKDKEQVKINNFIVSVLEENKNNLDYLHITGHTDSDAIKGKGLLEFADNKVLSTHRAKMVTEELQKIFPKVPMSFEGKAASLPISSNDNAQGKALNRRTEVWVYLSNTKHAELSSTSLAETKTYCIGDACPKGTELPARVTNDGKPLRITADGEDLQRDYYNDQSPTNHVDFQRCTDVALEKANVQVRFNALEYDKKLNVNASANFVNVGENIDFKMYTNYREFIEKAEVRIFEQADSTQVKPYQILPLHKKNKFSWSEANWKTDLGSKDFLGQDKNYFYTLRVYNADGQFDETKTKSFVVKRLKTQQETSHTNLNQGYGQNNLIHSNIAVYGGSVIVNAQGIPSNYTPTIMGEEIPLDSQGRFVTEQILKPGSNYGIEVLVHDKNKKGLEFRRDLYIPKNDWFYVGIADFTAGRNYSKGPVELVKNDDHHYQDKVWLDGRLAFYLKGKIQGKYLLTATADTREQSLNNLFNNFTSKDPTELFKRIDPDKYYPVYGDDSTLREDAPTQGKFYVKIQKDESHLLWGNFRTKLTTTELAQFDKGLYGAELKLQSAKNISATEKASSLNLFAASPETITSREDYVGTGGSFYWLRNRDITIGSERVYVEIRDQFSDIVLQRNNLTYNQDYTINYIQGTVLLKEALPSKADQSQLVRAGNLVGNNVFLVVTYEYHPGFTNLSSLTYGGRAQQWLGDHLKLGVSATKLKETGNNQEVLGTDVTVKFNDKSYIKAEAARSKGQRTELNSFNGGYDFNPYQSSNLNGDAANAYMVEGVANLYSTKNGEGKVITYLRKRDQGFATNGQITQFQTDQIGGELRLPISFAHLNAQWNTKYDLKEELHWRKNEVLSSDLLFKLSQVWSLSVGLQSNDLEDISGGLATATTVSDYGKRLDGISQINFKPGDEYDAYVFVQNTLSKDSTRINNDRYGLGGNWRISKRFKLGGEVSEGNNGLGSKVRTSYNLEENSEIYFTYQLDNLRTDYGTSTLLGRNGSLVSGVKKRYGDSSSIFYEGRYDNGNTIPSGLTHHFGVDYNITKKWAAGFAMEKGDLESRNGLTKTSRRAASTSVSYTEKDIKAGGALEYRTEDSNGITRDTWLGRFKFSSKLGNEWRITSNLDISRSSNSQGNFYNGDWTEGILGFAYRPIQNDKLNMLFRYNYLEVLPSVGQVDRNGGIPNYKQRFNILSIDAIYDLSRIFSLGAKYGFRYGELQDNRLGTGPWYKSDAHLAILRLDMHFIYQWDMIAEYRRLWAMNETQARDGVLLAIYRNLAHKSSLKLGVGYNFADFSDNLSDPNYRYSGWFVNFVGGI